MTTEWYHFWNENDQETKRLDDLFSYKNEPLSIQFILNQLNARKNDIIVEVGCGEGKILNCISKSVNEVIGVDFSEERTRNIDQNKISILINDAFDISIKDVSVDKVFCDSLFNFLNDHEVIAVIQEMFRITKKNGIILFSNILKKDCEFSNELKYVKCPKLNSFDKLFFEKIIKSFNDVSEPIIYDNELHKEAMNILVRKI